MLLACPDGITLRSGLGRGNRRRHTPMAMAGGTETTSAERRVASDTPPEMAPSTDRLGEPDAVEDDTEDESAPTTPYRILSYGADYTVDSLVKRLQSEAFYIPRFQRAYVWDRRQASRFIESLLLGLPVPGVFVARESGSSRHLIIDGQQRLKTLQYFFENNFGDSDRKFQLTDVASNWSGLTINDLDPDDRQRLEDSVLRVTIFKQEHPEDNRSIYSVFERLNTGSSKLYPQEIRNCVSHGKFIDLLNELNTNESWRLIFGPYSKRQKDQELVLRFLAFYFEGERYRGPIREFLNQFAAKHRNLGEPLWSQFRDVFLDSIQTAYGALGDRAFRPKSLLNAAVFDSVMVGIAKRIEQKPVSNLEQLKDAYDALLTDEKFVSGFKVSTSNAENVKTRFACARTAFRDIE